MLRASTHLAITLLTTSAMVVGWAVTADLSLLEPSFGLPPVAAGNARAGDRGAEHEIEGFADRVSVLPGEGFRLFVSTTADRYTVRAFRMGWYGGAGARKVWESAGLPGIRQSPPETVAATRTVTSHWEPGPRVDTSGWPEGSYLILLDAATGGRRYIPITVGSVTGPGA
ncbi:N,N-dimethylformamidase beta subunit family domain-containing protein [Streptosporangium sp. NPDC000396]|uniref:N,N-dimethylformamidase beta subunit family domain-containing protein n=1 Tax=Streptosporangium sp. NPDC000396 TaxID=3366185 RepID=UPI0036CB60AE